MVKVANTNGPWGAPGGVSRGRRLAGDSGGGALPGRSACPLKRADADVTIRRSWNFPDVPVEAPIRKLHWAGQPFTAFPWFPGGDAVWPRA